MARDEGVSAIVGGILLLGLIGLTFVLIQVQWVPVWEEDAEAAHMHVVERQLADLTSDAVAATQNGTASSQGHPVTLGDKRASRLFQPVDLPSDLRFRPGVANVTIAADSFQTTFRDGVSLLPLAAPYTPPSVGTLLTNADGLAQYLVRITDVDTRSDGTYSALIRGLDNQQAARIDITLSSPGNDQQLVVLVSDASGTVLSSHHDFFGGGSVPVWTYDLLGPDSALPALIADAPAPYDVQVLSVSTGMGLEHALGAWYAAADGHRALVGGGGSTPGTLLQVLPGGELEFESNNIYFVAQTYRAAAGALILEQSDASVFRVPPAFDVSVVDVPGGTPQTVISWSLPRLSGDPQSVAGARTLSVDLDVPSPRHVEGRSPALSIEVSSSHPELWAALWTDRLDAAGLQQVSGQYAVSTTATTAHLDVWGYLPDPGSTVPDVHLRLNEAVVTTTIRV